MSSHGKKKEEGKNDVAVRLVSGRSWKKSPFSPKKKSVLPSRRHVSGGVTVGIYRYHIVFFYRNTLRETPKENPRPVAFATHHEPLCRYHVVVDATYFVSQFQFTPSTAAVALLLVCAITADK